MAAASTTAAEELWCAARALPAQMASLVSLPAASSHQAAQGARAATHAAAVRAGLQRSALLHQLAHATSQYGKRDGPLPLHIEACAALLLVLGGAVAAPRPYP